MQAEEARRLTQLEKENAGLKKLLAEAELEKAMLKDLVAPRGAPRGATGNFKVCFPTRSFSVQQLLEGLLRAEATESHVASVAGMEPEIAGQPDVPLR